jgi:hypothetical protein
VAAVGVDTLAFLLSIQYVVCTLLCSIAGATLRIDAFYHGSNHAVLPSPMRDLRSVDQTLVCQMAIVFGY